MPAPPSSAAPPVPPPTGPGPNPPAGRAGGSWTVSLGSIFGIPLLLHWSFPLLLAWVIYTGSQRGAAAPEIAVNCLLVLAVFGCVLLHECGHALAGRWYGIGTRDITLLPLGGVARLERMPATPLGEIVVALAGPAVNVAIALLIAAAFAARDGLAGVTNARIDPFAGGFAEQLMVLNVFLVVFNLIPAFPMDGGRVLRAVLTWPLGAARASLVAAYASMAIALGFVGLGLWGAGPFLVLIGVFIFLAAWATAGPRPGRARSPMSGRPGERPG